LSLETGMFPLAHITASYGTQLGLYVTHQSPRPKEEPDDSTEDARRAGEVGAAAPPTDVDTTGSSPEIDAQAATTAPEDWTQNPYVQIEGGFLAGVSLGLVPVGGVGHQLLDAGEVLPHGTPEARLGLSVGMIVGGIVTTAGGLGGEFLGGAATSTGIGAAIGVPAMVVSAGLVVGGAGNVAAGIRGLTQSMMSNGSGGSAGTEVRWTSYGGKHVANSQTSWRDTVDGTKNGPAKYRPGTNIQQLERQVWAEGSPASNGKSWKVMEFDEVIGASGGAESRWVRVEESAGTIHGHPITRREYLKLR